MALPFVIEETRELIRVEGRHYKVAWARPTGTLAAVCLSDGVAWHDVLGQGKSVGTTWTLPVVTCEVTDRTDDFAKIVAVHENASWRLNAEYEIFARGYVICTFALEARVDQARAEPLSVGVALDESTVFSHAYRVVNVENDPNSPLSVRALAVDFSTDDRPVTNSINFLLESVTQNVNGRACRKVYECRGDHRWIGWDLGAGGYFPKGYRYANRWALTVSALDNRPNKVRGQRIYHWYGAYPVYPPDDVLTEMAEYGGSILALHGQIFVNIDGNVTHDEGELRRVVDRAHELGMKVIFYCQPYLISIESPKHEDLSCRRTEALRIWHSMADTQICMYEPHSRWDCDELCLRCEDAYEYIRDAVVRCWKKFNFDGLYVDFAWPAQGLCSGPTHPHGGGLFNFYDYLRMLRDLRNAIGPEGIMIGHGGGFLVASDFVEAFDACLTGEAQRNLDPVTIGQQIGPAPTLWAMHRRKQDAFRSPGTIENLIREGMTPHTGAGVMGTSVIATLDPGHNVPLLALWQMWRAFPMHRATLYNYLTECVVELDNKEVVYSLYVTDDPYALLILANAGGPLHDKSPAVGVNVKIDVDKLALPKELNCWRMKGNTYETFRIANVAPVENGGIAVPELMLHEFIAFVLSPGDGPAELVKLMRHLEGRPERLPNILKTKQKRLAEYDALIDHFATLPIAANKMKYDEFMKGRVAE